MRPRDTYRKIEELQKNLFNILNDEEIKECLSPSAIEELERMDCDLEPILKDILIEIRINES